ncbi:MAG TPA: hypothetical protein DCE76_00865 [Anaerolineaceae bacterium]|nr:hypothetical protein [Anaerolineaceae bacterium]
MFDLQFKTKLLKIIRILNQNTIFCKAKLESNAQHGLLINLPKTVFEYFAANTLLFTRNLLLKNKTI